MHLPVLINNYIKGYLWNNLFVNIVERFVKMQIL